MIMIISKILKQAVLFTLLQESKEILMEKTREFTILPATEPAFLF